MKKRNDVKNIYTEYLEILREDIVYKTRSILVLLSLLIVSISLNVYLILSR